MLGAKCQFSEREVVDVLPCFSNVRDQPAETVELLADRYIDHSKTLQQDLLLSFLYRPFLQKLNYPFNILGRRSSNGIYMHAIPVVCQGGASHQVDFNIFDYGLPGYRTFCFYSAASGLYTLVEVSTADCLLRRLLG